VSFFTVWNWDARWILVFTYHRKRSRPKFLLFIGCLVRAFFQFIADLAVIVFFGDWCSSISLHCALHFCVQLLLSVLKSIIILWQLLSTDLLTSYTNVNRANFQRSSSIFCHIPNLWLTFYGTAGNESIIRTLWFSWYFYKSPSKLLLWFVLRQFLKLLKQNAPFLLIQFVTLINRHSWKDISHCISHYCINIADIVIGSLTVHVTKVI